MILGRASSGEEDGRFQASVDECGGGADETEIVL